MARAGLRQIFLGVIIVVLMVQGWFTAKKIIFNLPVSDQTTRKKMSPTMTPAISSTEGQCHYRIQIYNTHKELAKRTPVFPNLQMNLSCDNHCNIELILDDEKKKFAGMDAVIFHFFGAYSIPMPHPTPVDPNQTWIYFSWESPRSNAKTEEHLEINSLPVHATWTYHRASEIVTPYGFYRPGVPMTNETKSPQEWVKGKTKLVVWMASNCKNIFWPRTAFVAQLQKFIPVDVYGECGPLKCKPKGSAKCFKMLRQYKFYLSLENAECGDYITEKLWQKPLTLGIVPIVYGPTRKVYEELLPPNSFIYVGDYKNMQELADYIKRLDSKPELYAKYLEWQYTGSTVLIKFPPEDPSLLYLCNQVIPIIKKFKRGELERVPVGNSQFAKACRPPNTGRSNYGVQKWGPW